MSVQQSFLELTNRFSKARNRLFGQRDGFADDWEYAPKAARLLQSVLL